MTMTVDLHCDGDDRDEPGISDLSAANTVGPISRSRRDALARTNRDLPSSGDLQFLMHRGPEILVALLVFAAIAACNCPLYAP